MFRRITDRFAGGTVVLDTHDRLAVKGVDRVPKRIFGAPMLTWAIDDGHELERAVPLLRDLSLNLRYEFGGEAG
ncbi:hypothetical protein [Allonocardiopsis opalescens]|uniref:hypothetical protein n=1 Tax=Allonocardiopsis opalescens TaxID=1144618 RepID=UPI001475560E|nr:hypothetical protein [Allonocardiopsis opalescens]